MDVKKQIQAMAGAVVPGGEVNGYTYNDVPLGPDEVLVGGPTYDPVTGARSLVIMTVDDAEAAVLAGNLDLAKLPAVESGRIKLGDTRGVD